MKMTYQQVLQYFREEQFDLVFATEEQILRASEEEGYADIHARWEDYQEEMRCMILEAQAVKLRQTLAEAISRYHLEGEKSWLSHSVGLNSGSLV